MIGSGSGSRAGAAAVVAGAVAVVLLAPAPAAGVAGRRPAAPAERALTERAPAGVTGLATALGVGRAKTALARTLALSLADARWAGQLRTALSAGDVDPLALARRAAGASGGAATSVRAAAAEANRGVLAAKGLPASTGSILELRLAGKAAAQGIDLVAVEVDDDRATTVPAFDRSGRRHDLDARAVPAATAAVLGIDEHRALTAGLAVLRGELTRYGVARTGSARRAPQAVAGFWTTRAMSVRLGDDEEPWFKGDAEIYSIVSGVGVTGEPQVDVVQMPYLDEDGRWYHPGQILVDWSHFRYNAVDAVMMEEDDGTNYRALAQAIATALLTVLGEAQYAPMVNAVLDAMPDSWWTDDPDYVDSWYLLTRQTNEQRAGARGNGAIVVAPYFVTPN
jgi:hypothetical protein